jgi:hypothetical protein
MIESSHWPLANEVKFRKDFHISYSIFHIRYPISTRRVVPAMSYVIWNMEYEI